MYTIPTYGAFCGGGELHRREWLHRELRDKHLVSKVIKWCPVPAHAFLPGNRGYKAATKHAFGTNNTTF